MTEELRAPLSSVPFFSKLGGLQLSQVIQAGTEEFFPSGTLIFEEGDAGELLYVIVRGSVEVFRAGTSGERVGLIELRAGDFFGELALLDGSPRSASVKVLEDARMFSLGRSAFLELVSSDRTILCGVLAALSHKLRRTGRQVFESALERECQRARSEVDRHRAISEMVAGVAHEINTPLGIVNSAASIVTETLTHDSIEKFTSVPEYRDELQSVADACTLIQSNIQRANRLIGSFKNLSAHHANEALEEVDLIDLTTEVVDMFQIRAKRLGIEVRLDQHLGSSRYWTGFPGHYTQILLNLLNNAQRYGYPDGSSGSIVIRLEHNSDQSSFQVSVEDFGAGIPYAYQGRIFDAFFTTGRGRGGTGLGLSIVHNLVVHSLGGTIQVESTPGAGTKFTLCFPKLLVARNTVPPEP